MSSTRQAQQRRSATDRALAAMNAGNEPMAVDGVGPSMPSAWCSGITPEKTPPESVNAQRAQPALHWPLHFVLNYG